MAAKTQRPGVQVIPDGLYTPSELRLMLTRYRQRSVPKRTLRWWRHQLGIAPTSAGLYTAEDLATLIQLVRWLSRGGTVKQFYLKLREAQNANGSE